MRGGSIAQRKPVTQMQTDQQFAPQPAHRRFTFEEARQGVDERRQRINQLRERLSSYFVGKEEIVDLMVVGTLAQEPVLLVGPPGTAKSDLIVKFAQAIGVTGSDYFEYMLTKFSEPSEIIGPIDLAELKTGRYVRRVAGKLPDARIVFLDEIFKSNSAILNTLLTIINERKYYQDGKPHPVNLVMLFGATNEIPEHSDLAALRDRFTLKVRSETIHDAQFDELIDMGLRNESFKAFQTRPWEGIASLDDFLLLKTYLDQIMFGGEATRGVDGRRTGDADRKRYFPEDMYALFRRIIKTLEAEDRIEITDRKVIKLYKLIRTRAFLIHGGTVGKDDLSLLRYIPDRLADFTPVRDKVDALLRLG